MKALGGTRPLKCNACGQFIPWKDFGVGLARRELVTPDSHYSYEEYETLCATCAFIEDAYQPNEHKGGMEP